MTGSALVLAAHGSRLEPAINTWFRACAANLVKLGSFDEITVAFHHGEPAYAKVLDTLSADTVTVVPLMTSDGHFSEVVLRRELARNARFGQIRVRQTPPVGTHPDMVTLVARRAHARLREYGLDADDTTLAVIGHGTRRHQGSRDATVDLTDALRERDCCAEVLAAFLDEEPLVESVCRRATQPHVVVVPFLITDGPHAIVDIPKRLGMSVGDSAQPPFLGHVEGRLVVCDGAVGTDPGIIEIVADLARRPRAPETEVVQ